MQLSEHRQPKLRPFVLRDPNPQQLLVSFQVDTKRQMNGFVDNAIVFSDFNHERIHSDDGVERIERAGMPGFDFIDDGIGDIGD